MAEVHKDPFTDENMLHVELFSSLHNTEAIITRICEMKWHIIHEFSATDITLPP
jgi:hypothetical protein